MDKVEAAPGEATEEVRKGFRRLLGVTVGWNKVRSTCLEAAGAACGAAALLGRGHPFTRDAAQAIVIAGYVRDSLRAPNEVQLTGEAVGRKEDLPVAELAAAVVAGVALAAARPGLVSVEGNAAVLPALALLAMTATTTRAVASELGHAVLRMLAPPLAVASAALLWSESKRRGIEPSALAGAAAGAFLLVGSARMHLRHNWADLAAFGAHYVSPAFRSLLLRFDWRALVDNKFNFVKTALAQVSCPVVETYC